jgi:hypothetical protein
LNKGRTIQIFLPFGSPRGIKIAEITNRTVQAIYIPRNELDRVEVRDEIKNVGVYYLFGQGENDSKPEVYIGEAENCFNRLKEHNRSKEFWEMAVVFVTNNAQNQFTKTDVKFLERTSFDIAKDISRYKLNQTTPQSSFVPEWRTVDLYDIFETIKILLSTLGFPVFESLRKSDRDDYVDIYYIRSKGIEAMGEYNEDGFVVFKNSVMHRGTTKSIHNYLISKRHALVKDKVVIEQGDHYIFTEDHQFTSPSQAAAVVLGRNANGWMEWKNKDGETLDVVKRKSN